MSKNRFTEECLSKADFTISTGDDIQPAVEVTEKAVFNESRQVQGFPFETYYDIADKDQKSAKDISEKTVRTSNKRRKPSTRKKRQKDRDRKRHQRLVMKEIKPDENIAFCDVGEQSADHTITKLTKTFSENLTYKEKKNLRQKTRYDSDYVYREQKLLAQRIKYRTKSAYREQRISVGKEKYRGNKDYQQSMKTYSRKKYRENDKHQQSVKQFSTQKYRDNQHHQLYLKRASMMKYRCDRHFRWKVKRASVEKYHNNSVYREQLKRANALKYRESVIIREKYRQRLRDQYKRDLTVRQRKIRQVQQRLIHKKNSIDIASFFRQEVRDGPTFICCVCHKFKFRKQVVVCDNEIYFSKGEHIFAVANQCISRKFLSSCTNECQEHCEKPNHNKLWICYTCHRHLLKGEMPADAEANNLKLPPIPEELQSMNTLEKQLISLRIPFMKLVQLPKGGQRGIIGPCVSIPTDIEKTTQVLPRCDDDNQLLRCKLKRKLQYKGHSQYEFVSTYKVRKGLEYLKQNNAYYSDTSLHPSWLEPVPEDVADITVRDDVVIPGTSVVDTESGDIDKNNETPESEEDQILKDRGMLFDTCLQPVDLGQEILDQHFDDIFCLAPGEGKTPVNMLREEGNEAMSFPVQFPLGSTGTYDVDRPVRLTRLRYFHSRLLNADTRFSSDPSYIFYAQYLSELEQVISKVSIALRKSTAKDASGNEITANMLTDRNKLKNLLKTDQGYKFLTPIRGTPPYWQATLKDLMAMIRQLGIPTWFCTFSAADLRWIEILQVLQEQQGSTQSVQDLDWAGKCKLLKNSPIMNALLFDYRFHTFLKQIIIERKVIGKIKDHFYRIEFQQRGSPHAHCLFWVDGAPLLDKNDDQTVCDFVDQYVTCVLPDQNEDPELHDIASSVQQHSKNHSKSCKKKGTTCRFNFPRPPSEKTFVSRTQSLTDPSIQKSPQEMMCKAQATLQRVWQVIQNVELEVMTTQNLFAAAGITQSDFEEASNILTKRTNIVLQRKPKDAWINQYNADLLRCWNANMDIQYVTDAYSCVMYIISYISKAEREMGLVLENARTEAAEGNLDAQQAMKQIGGAYLRQREVSAQEAAYRVCGLHMKETSRKVQFVPAGDNQVKMSLPLNVIQRRSNELDDGDIWMSSLYDKYKARPVNEDFDQLCYASFCSQYRLVSPSQLPKKANTNVYKLQNNLGYIQKRTRTEDAVVRYPRFSVKKNAELYYKAILQLFLPHRIDEHLKPANFQTYEDFYSTGAIVLTSVTELQCVKTVVESNRHYFEQNAEDLDDAQDLIDRYGPLEDAWALIGPESEAERLESELEKEHTVDEGDIAIPELQTPHNKNKETNLEINNRRFTSHEIQPLLRMLNNQQKRVFYRVRQWCLDRVNGQQPEPFRVFINGGAGTGKSHLIKCLYFEATKILSPYAPNPDDTVVLLTAPTATAAFNIGGTTLHQAFSLSKSLTIPYQYLRDAELNTLRTRLQNLVILIIDEISMVGQRVLTYVNERLRQIKQSGNALFGNLCIIAVGDFYQLPPVKQKCLYDLRPENFFPLWSSNFSLVELYEIMRQRNDAHFAELLNRLRVKKKREHLQPDDQSCLQECAKHSVPPDTLHIFATNGEVKRHNNTMIAKICQVTQTVSAQDYDKDPRSGKLIPKESPYDTSHDYLPSQLLVGPKARVMLIRNVDISVGLVNGAMGTVSSILPPPPHSSLPRAIQVIFDNEKIGKTNTSHLQPKPILNIEPFEEKLKNNGIRHQFPLRLAWACTTHKVQGITTDKAVVSLKHTFAAGMAYVALSRVTSIEGLVIQDFDEDKIYCTEQISDALQRMPPFLPTLQQEVGHNKLHILLHNIQGLLPHIADMQANSDVKDANFICLTETWIEPNSTTPPLKNFNLIHKPRFSSYTCGSPLFKDLKHRKHGGVGVYVRNDQQIRYLQLDECNIEYVAVYVPHIDTNLVVVYRPEIYKASVFLEQLQQLLLLLPHDVTATIILGDFNQDIYKPNSSIKQFMEQHGFTQLMNNPTTDGGTLIDHVYIHGALQASVDKIPTYYSYHDIVSVEVRHA